MSRQLVPDAVAWAALTEDQRIKLAGRIARTLGYEVAPHIVRNTDDPPQEIIRLRALMEPMGWTAVRLEGTEGQQLEVVAPARLEARRSLRESQVNARLFLAAGLAISGMALFVDWRAALLPALLGVIFYWAVHAGAPKAGVENPIVFAIDERGIQVGDADPMPWTSLSAVKLQSQMFGARGAYLIIEFVEPSRTPTDTALSELDVKADHVRAVVGRYAPHLLGKENPLFRA